MDKDTYMKAPQGVSSMVCEGHDYQEALAKGKGTIQVKQEAHIETLKRHGFTEVDSLGKLDPDGIDDKDELVRLIEERGGEADSDMKLSKLRRILNGLLAEAEA